VPDASGRGTVRVEVPEDRRSEACLHEEHLAALVEIARRVERHYGAHQDVEWALARGRRLPDALVVLQARDAGGKDGTVRKVFGACNPLGCQVTSFKTPTPLELSHDYLWRVHQAVPAKGMVGIFNRSHYEDVLVVRVKDLVPKPIWSKRYDQINEFEQLLDENRVKVLKFFLHISREEQTRRLRDRLSDPRKNWKFRAGDLDDRDLWDEYTKAYRDALRQCSTPWAPWYVVPADDKKARNYFIAKTVVETLEGLGLRYPKADREVLKLRRKLK
jgi:PPK2 family polyphosphate:nucleotide phosphotransferase